MKNNLIEYKKPNLIRRLIVFLKNQFYKKRHKNKNVLIEDTIKETSNYNVKNDNSEVKSKEKTNEQQKRQFLDLYERAKDNIIDLNSLDEETLRKLCILIQEEIKIVKKTNIEKRKQIKEFEEKIHEIQLNKK